jgi:hypothetical protein
VNGYKLNYFVPVFSISQICRLQAITGATALAAADRLQSVASNLIGHRSLRRKGKHDYIPAHPFILYHVSRALLSCQPHLRDAAQRDSASQLIADIAGDVRNAVERLLAKHYLGALAPSESVALAFCGGALLCLGRLEDLPYVLASLAVCLECQDASGCWPLGRVVREDKDITSDKLEIPTFEIAAVIADSVHDLLEFPTTDVEPALLRTFYNRLVRSALYAERSIVHLPVVEEPRVGWCTDHAYGSELIESWTSATVLLMMLSVRRLIEETRRREILEAFVTVSPKDRDWPDWLRWKKYVVTSEFDSRYPVLKYLDDRVIKPILSEPRGLPASEPRSVSVLLFGPPGTAKTTLVKAVADGLRWPVVMLSPGNFIERGLEYIEAQARSVFDRLLELSRAVVLFDECDELFRERKPLAGTEQTRGITAFVTASMLPKLQELHDRGRVVFFICTNNFESMDSAVKRGGRIDHIIGVGPPDKEARRQILIQWLQGKRKTHWSQPAYLEETLDELAAESDRFIRSELVRACDLLAGRANWTNAQQAKDAARAVVGQLEPGLTIQASELQKYRELSKKVSRPMQHVLDK